MQCIPVLAQKVLLIPKMIIFLQSKSKTSIEIVFSCQFVIHGAYIEMQLFIHLFSNICKDFTLFLTIAEFNGTL